MDNDSLTVVDPDMMCAVPASHAANQAPAATRTRPPGWRDPRLWVGVAIVAASVIAGARILAAADDSVTVWSAAHDLAPGDTLSQTDLVPTAVQFGDPADLDRYLLTTDALPLHTRLTRGLGEGDLVPSGALASSEEADTVIVSLAFPHEHIPTSIGTGSRIELLVVPDDEANEGSPVPSTVMSDVVVIDAPVAALSLIHI